MTATDLAHTVGAETIGVALAFFLGGVSLQQTFFYFHNYPRDRWQFRLLVGALAVLNCCHSIALIVAIYRWDILQWGEHRAMDFAPRSFSVSVLLSAPIVEAVLFFYAYRIFITTKSYIISGLIIFGAAIHLLSCGTVAIYLIINVHQSALTRINPVVLLISTSCAFVDIIITTTMLCNLKRSERRHRDTERIIRRISILSIQTNAITCLISLITVIVYLTNGNGWDNATYFVCTKMYIISLLAVLNARPPPSDMDTETMRWMKSSLPILFPPENSYIITQGPSELGVVHSCDIAASAQRSPTTSVVYSPNNK